MFVYASLLLALAVCASCHVQIDTCWDKSVEAVERSCHTMGMEKQQELALDSLNCHLQMNGRAPYVCSGQELKQCLGVMDSTRFLLFSYFFDFVGTTCQNRQVMSWQHSVAGKLDNLFKTAQDTVEIQSEISKGQKKLNDGLDAAEETQVNLGHQFHLIASMSSELLASLAGLNGILEYTTSMWAFVYVGLVCLLVLFLLLVSLLRHNYKFMFRTYS